jgi:hypothetical protein
MLQDHRMNALNFTLREQHIPGILAELQLSKLMKGHWDLPTGMREPYGQRALNRAHGEITTTKHFHSLKMTQRGLV